MYNLTTSPILLHPKEHFHIFIYTRIHRHTHRETERQDVCVVVGIGRCVRDNPQGQVEKIYSTHLLCLQCKHSVPYTIFLSRHVCAFHQIELPAKLPSYAISHRVVKATSIKVM